MSQKNGVMEIANKRKQPQTQTRDNIEKLLFKRWSINQMDIIHIFQKL